MKKRTTREEEEEREQQQRSDPISIRSSAETKKRAAAEDHQEEEEEEHNNAIIGIDDNQQINNNKHKRRRRGRNKRQHQQYPQALHTDEEIARLREEIPGIGYFQEFITKDEELDLIRQIDTEGEWTRITPTGRRVQQYGYEYHYSHARATDGDPPHEPKPIPAYFRFLLRRLVERGILNAEPDQAIINEYLGAQGISPHVDKQDRFGDTIVSISMGADCLMRFHQLPPETTEEDEATNNNNNNNKNKEHPTPTSTGRPHVVDFVLEQRSLLVLTGDARYRWQHEIPREKTFALPDGHSLYNRMGKRRISITFRTVLKQKNNKQDDDNHS